ncbi:GNAT family N-acetyltransferase [Amycolatopsis tucumanensis]|uniref:GNAT family N-acetyltransferase n=1 Tax=Amycolatopsis tucumanensis TaxID=401106 RepID=A0ABP7HLV0_9PSEU|nr:GNAT family N-acetyltransferase [Amycolatopsis tucumanensis]MCF6425404.1 GNAT family N-acetyltransferase [Amycolatopsis tucumanensis]
MTEHIRTLTTADEINAGFRVFLRAMVGLPFRDVDAVEVTDPGRYLGALDGTEVVGGADSYGSWLAVPGGARVPHAAVTHVGVLPTHRRRGIVSRLIARQLEDIAARGEVVASLRASEAVIYERFGYGVASSVRSARVNLRRAKLRPEVPAGGRVRLLDRAVTTEALAGIADRAAWPGAIGRPAGWWRLQEILRAADPVTHYVVVHSTEGVDDGYAVYRPLDTGGWFASQEKTVTVTDFVALTDSARAGLWRHLLSLDLVDVIAFESLPLDDPLPLAVVDRRAVELGPERDETWLRLVDVEAALRERAWGEEDAVALRVSDPLLESNNGTFEVGPKSVARTNSAPHLSADVATLAAAYLGGTRWRHLAAAGRVAVHDPDALRRADALFATPSAPFSGTVF